MLKRKDKSLLWGNVVAIIVAILFAVGIRTFWIQPFYIPSGSMIPTLLIGDNLLVTKGAYGYSRYSFPFGHIFDYMDGRIASTFPQLGDVVVFRPVTMADTDFIKRVVGTPGDRVQMRDGILYINDEEALLERIDDYVTVGDDGHTLQAAQFIETLPNGIKHRIIKQLLFGQARYDNTREFLVPEGHYFMMGDNRDGSSDSRAMSTVGYVPFNNIVGKAGTIFFSTGGHYQLFEVWKWLPHALYSRAFTTVHK